MSRVFADLQICRFADLLCALGPQGGAEPPHQRRAGAAHGYELRQELDRIERR